MTAHPLVVDVQRMTADPAMHARVATAAETVGRALEAALGCSDPDVAREQLPAALRTLYTTIQPLVAGGLLSGSTWLDAQHRRLYAHAQTLFGAEAERIVRRPHHDPLDLPAGRTGLFRV